MNIRIQIFGMIIIKYNLLSIYCLLDTAVWCYVLLHSHHNLCSTYVGQLLLDNHLPQNLVL